MVTEDDIMTRCMRFLAILLCLLIPPVESFPSSQTDASPHRITVVSDDNYPPYIFQDDQGKIQGIIVDQWKLWGQKTGIRVELRAMDWTKAQDIMRNGQADVIDTIFETPSRDLIYHFSKPYARIEVPIFFHKSISGIKDIKSVRGFTIGVKKGDACIEMLRQNGIISGLIEYDNYKDIIRDAMQQKLRVFCMDKPPAFYYLNKFGIAADFHYTQPLYTGKIHRAVARGRMDLLEVVDDGFSRITKSEYQAINLKWLGQEVPLGRYSRNLVVFSLVVVSAALLLLIFSLLMRREVKSKTAELLEANRRLQDEVRERKAAEEQLRQSEAKYRFITEKMSDIVWTVDENFKTTYVSPSVEKAIGYTPEERMVQEAVDTLTPESYARAMELFQSEAIREQAMGAESGRPVAFDLEFRHKNGSTVWMENMASFIHDDQGKIVGVHAVSRDITEKRKAEGLLRLSEQKFESAFQSSPDPMAITDLDTGLIVDANSAFLAWTGCSRDEVVGKSVTELGFWANPEDRLWIIESMKDGMPVNHVELELRSRSKGVRLMKFWARFLDIGGKHFLFTLAHDITDEKISAAKVRESEEHLRSLFANMVEGVALHELVFDRDGNAVDYRIIDVNPAYERITGLKRGDVAGKKATEAYRQPEAPYLEAFTRVAITGSPFTMEVFFQPMGRHFDISVAPWGKNGFATIFTDITERKQAEEELRRLASAIHQASESIVITDPEGMIRYVNPAFEKITGYAREEAVGSNPRFLRSGEQDEDFYRELWATIAKGETWTGRFTNRRKDGTLFHEDAAITPIRDDGGRIVNFVAVKRDITREVNLEEQLLRSQKLEAIGTLAGGIAHDFNNILSIIIGYTELSLEAAPDLGSVRDMLGEILKAGLRAKDLVKQILTFSRKMESRKEFVKVQTIVKETVKLLGSTIPKNIAIRSDIDPDAGPVSADPAKVHQIIMNLCTNAFHAMSPDGGDMTVSLATVEVDEELVSRFPSLKPGPHVKLVVEDTGCGMGEEIQMRIFDPFFTTKEKGRGTGLGLAMVYGITTELGGAISVSSSSGRGSSFSVYLPIAEASGDETMEDQADDPGKVGKKRHILLVDDEEAIVSFARIMLEGLGYTVTALSSSTEAKARFAADPWGFDLVLTDYSMPGMDGMQLASEIFRTRPETPVILMTGYSENISRDGMSSIGIRCCVEKPFNRRSIADAIEACLGA
jgi:PAS domain S-box-containing protein